MLDFNNILSTPGIDVQYFCFPGTSTEWKTWKKPRGVKNVYMIGVGGGASGATQGTAAGGGGGGSGAQSNVWLPAMFVPDTLYIQCGLGGIQPVPAVDSTYSIAGGTTYVCIEPDTTPTPNMTLLLANGGQAGTTTISNPSAGGIVATIAGMPLAGRGYYSFFAGQIGSGGGVGLGSSGASVPFPLTGLMVTGGSGGGGAQSTAGAISAPINTAGSRFFLPSVFGGVPGLTGSTPATSGIAGYTLPNFLMNYGGTGGGGGGNGSTTGGAPGDGGNGAPGAGGGGAGGNGGVGSPAKPGNGGDGFVLILSW